ncbi:unnamed protein product, partial [Allacma fusca]
MPNMKSSTTPVSQSPKGSLPRSENSYSSLSPSVFPKLDPDSPALSTERVVLPSTPRHSILRNADMKSPQLSSRLEPDTPRHSILRNVELNNNQRNSFDHKGNTPRPSVIRIDESGGRNSVKSNPDSNSSSQWVNQGDVSRSSLEPSPSSSSVNRISVHGARSRPSSVSRHSRQSILRIGDIEG